MKSKFQDLLLKEIFLPISQQEVVIKEDNNRNKKDKLWKLTIHGLDPEAIALKLDMKATKSLKERFGKEGCSRLSWLIADKRKFADQKCDLVIVQPYYGQVRILIGEMKSGVPKQSDYKFQLINSKLFMEYIISLLSEYYEFEKTLKFEYVVFTNSNRPLPRIHKNYSSQKKVPGEIRLRFVKVTGHIARKGYDQIWSANSVIAEKFFNQHSTN